MILSKGGGNTINDESTKIDNLEVKNLSISEFEQICKKGGKKKREKERIPKKAKERHPKKEKKVEEKKVCKYINIFKNLNVARETKPKSDEYILKKNTTMMFLRVIFWGMLVFLFAKGVFSSFSKDSSEEAISLIKQFKTEFNNYKDQDAEILSFAQNFVKEYLTYGSKGEAEYKQRIEPYVSSGVLSNNLGFKGTAKAVYTQAYRKEFYSENQADVYVLAEVTYISRKITENQEYIEVSEIEQAVLKVPVFIKDNNYIVEDLPVFVNDDIKIGDFQGVVFYGTEIEREEGEAIKQALSNFYKSYYEDQQNVINYYLYPDADKGKFTGLNKRFKFEKIDNIKSYLQPDNTILCLVTVNIADKNGATMPQKFNLVLVRQDNKFYIKDMSTRNINLNL